MPTNFSNQNKKASVGPSIMNNNCKPSILPQKENKIKTGPSIIKTEETDKPIHNHYGPSRIQNGVQASQGKIVSKPTILPITPRVSNDSKKSSATIAPMHSSKKDVQYVATPTVISNAIKGVGINSQYIDKVIDNYGKFSLEEYQRIRELLKDFDFSSLRLMLEFGDAVQQKYSEMHSKMLSLTSNGHVNIEIHLNEIAKIITAIDYEDLVESPSMWKSLFSGLSVREKLAIAIKSIEASVHYVEKMIPDLMHHIDALQTIEKGFISLDKELHCHIIALKIAIKYNQDELDNEKIDVLTKRLNSLLQNSMDNQSIPMQISLMKTTLINKTENAKNTILGLVATWKSHCSTALAVLESKKSLGGLAGDIIATRDKLLNVLDKVS